MKNHSNEEVDSSMESEKNPDNNESEASASYGESSEESMSDNSIESENEKLKAEVALSNDKFIRLYSEFDNYKKRVSKEKVEFAKFAGTEIFLSLLPILDDFERAMKAIKEAENSEALLEGIQLIYSKFKSTLTQKGLLEMKSEGETFDSELHDAVTTSPAPTEKMKGKVVQELEKGYFINGKVLRHAKVIVGN